MPPFQIPWVFGAAASMARSVPAGDAFSQVNMPLPQHLTRARGMLAALPESLTQAAREPFDANALIYAMLLSPDDPVRAAQMKSLEMPGTEALMDTTAKLYPALAGVERDSRLALAALAMPALRRLTSAQYDTFSRGVRCLVEADQQIDLFEYALQKMLRRQLDPQFAPGPKTVVQFYVIKPLVPDCVVLLSALAHVGRQEGSLTLAAFQAGTARLGPVASGLALLDGDPCSLSQVDQALERLGEASPRLKLSVLEACAQTVASDGVLQPDETALLRAIADTLDCPVPPFVEASAA